MTPNGFITIAATGPVSITGCTFGYVDAPQTGYIYNALEFSQSASYPVADGTTISGNTYSEHDIDAPDNKGWAGFFLFQNAGNVSGRDMTIRVTDLTYQGTADQLYVLYEDITSETTPWSPATAL